MGTNNIVVPIKIPALPKLVPIIVAYHPYDQQTTITMVNPEH